MKKSEWVCCFCGETIQVNLTDPCFLDLKTSRDRYEVEELVCHAACINKVLHPDFSLLTQA